MVFEPLASAGTGSWSGHRDSHKSALCWKASSVKAVSAYLYFQSSILTATQSITSVSEGSELAPASHTSRSSPAAGQRPFRGIQPIHRAGPVSSSNRPYCRIRSLWSSAPLPLLVALAGSSSCSLARNWVGRTPCWSACSLSSCSLCRDECRSEQACFDYWGKSLTSAWRQMFCSSFAPRLAITQVRPPACWPRARRSSHWKSVCFWWTCASVRRTQRRSYRTWRQSDHTRYSNLEVPLEEWTCHQAFRICQFGEWYWAFCLLGLWFLDGCSGPYSLQYSD